MSGSVGSLNLILYDSTVKLATREPSPFCRERWKCETCGWKDADQSAAVCWEAKPRSCFCWQSFKSKFWHENALILQTISYPSHLLMFAICIFRFCSSMRLGMFLWELRIWLPPFNQTVWRLNPLMLKCKIKVREYCPCLSCFVNSSVDWLLSSAICLFEVFVHLW